MNRSELIAALLEAKSPRRSLDAEIHSLRFAELRQAPWVRRGDCFVDMSDEGRNAAGGHNIVFPPSYTANIDAALQLVPREQIWRLGHYPAPEEHMPAGCYPYAARVGGPRYYDGHTAALALCTAALMAHAGGV